MNSKKSKIERRQIPTFARFLDYSAVAMLFSVDTKIRGRFSEKRCGPSRRCARNASAGLENFVCYPQKTFSTASTHSRRRCCARLSGKRILCGRYCPKGPWLAGRKGQYRGLPHSRPHRPKSPCRVQASGSRWWPQPATIGGWLSLATDRPDMAQL